MNDKQQSCKEKLSFDTKEQANAAALEAGHKYGTKLKSYKCGQCHLWHLTSKYY